MRRLLPVALSIMLAGVGAVSARAQEDQKTECTAAVNSLPDATEGVAYNAALFTSNNSSTGANGTATNLPAGLTQAGTYLRGTPTAPGSYTIGLTYQTACGKPLKDKSSNIDAGPPTTFAHAGIALKVRDTHPPTIASFKVTPDNLGFAGGSVTLAVTAGDNVGVTRVMMTTRHPDGHSGSALVPLSGGSAANGTWSISFSLGGNATSAPASYAFTIGVSDADGNTAKAGPSTVTLAAHAAQQVPQAVIKRP
ncbi:MAG TPA: hypothetical protein VF832_16630 [Longimicrobiales bacterium]